MTLQAETLKVNALGATEWAAWTQLQAQAAVYASPFFHPGFTRAVGAVRADAAVTILSEGGTIVGFFPHHRRPLGFLRPIGAPVSDWHGPLLDPACAVTLPALLALMGAAGLRLPNLADPFARFAAEAHTHDVAYTADFSGGIEAFFAWQEEARPKHAKNMRRCLRRVEAELGPPRFERLPAHGEALDQLLAWKRAQYQETGKHDVLGAPWVQALLRRLALAHDPGFRLDLWRMTAGGVTLASELVLRAGPVAQSWFPAYDRAFAAYSPGHLLAEGAFRGMASDGVARVEYGPGHGDYKTKITNATAPIFSAIAHAETPAGQLRGAAAAAWTSAEGHPMLGSAAGKLRRRLDHMAQTEASWTRTGLAALRLATSQRLPVR